MHFDRLVSLGKQISSSLKQIRIKRNVNPSENTTLADFNFNESNYNSKLNDENVFNDDLDGSVIDGIGSPDTCSSSIKIMHQYSIIPTKLNEEVPKVMSIKDYLQRNNFGDNINICKKKSENIKLKPCFNYKMHGAALSRKIAEYFLLQQAYLLENNECESLSPISLQQKLDELFGFESNYIDLHYLKFLNALRIKDYTFSSKYLHDYFDRFIVNGTISLAALNLVSLEYRFSNRLVYFYYLIPIESFKNDKKTSKYLKY